MDNFQQAPVVGWDTHRAAYYVCYSRHQCLCYAKMRYCYRRVVAILGSDESARAVSRVGVIISSLACYGSGVHGWPGRDAAAVRWRAHRPFVVVRGQRGTTREALLRPARIS